MTENIIKKINRAISEWKQRKVSFIEGTYGTVFVFQNKEEWHTLIAGKIIGCDEFDQLEVHTLRSCKHENIINFKTAEYWTDTKQYFIKFKELKNKFSFTSKPTF